MGDEIMYPDRLLTAIDGKTTYHCHCCGWSSSVVRTKPGEFLCNECLKWYAGGKFYPRSRKGI